jgi:hypothetical protein
MSRKGQEKAIDTINRAGETKNKEERLNEDQTLEIGQQQVVTQVFQSAIKRSLDETKENVQKSIYDARGQIPRYITTVKNYHEQALDLAEKMVEEYVDTQKSVLDSVFSSAATYYDSANRMYNHWYSPKVAIGIWARTVSNIGENMSAATRITNNILFGNPDDFGNTFERAQRHTEELLRINVNNVKLIANTAKEAAAKFSVDRPENL